MDSIMKNNEIQLEEQDLPEYLDYLAYFLENSSSA